MAEEPKELRVVCAGCKLQCRYEGKEWSTEYGACFMFTCPNKACEFFMTPTKVSIDERPGASGVKQAGGFLLESQAISAWHNMPPQHQAMMAKTAPKWAGKWQEGIRGSGHCIRLDRSGMAVAVAASQKEQRRQDLALEASGYVLEGGAFPSVD